MVQFEIYFPMWRYVDNLMKKGNKIILKKMKKLIKKTKNLGGLGKKVVGKAKQSQILQLYWQHSGYEHELSQVWHLIIY